MFPQPKTPLHGVPKWWVAAMGYSGQEGKDRPSERLIILQGPTGDAIFRTPMGRAKAGIEGQQAEGTWACTSVLLSPNRAWQLGWQRGPTQEAVSSKRCFSLGRIPAGWTISGHSTQTSFGTHSSSHRIRQRPHNLFHKAFPNSLPWEKDYNFLPFPYLIALAWAQSSSRANSFTLDFPPFQSPVLWGTQQTCLGR